METPSYGNAVLLDAGNSGEAGVVGRDALVDWVMERVNYWEQQRNTNYLPQWDEYYRIWRTEWNSDDRERMVERSRIMPTELSEAVSTSVAELVDAFFGREVWLDVDDNFDDRENEDVRAMARRLREDMDKSRVPIEIGKVFQNSAIYGTGIAKLTIGYRDKADPTQIVDRFGRTVLGGAVVGKEKVIGVVSVSPREFVIDPSARRIADALGCAHIVDVPRHQVLQQQRAGIYQSGPIPPYQPAGWRPYNIETSEGVQRESVRLVEYHGLVPRVLLEDIDDGDQMQAVMSGHIDADVEMVEAIVLIGNDQKRLHARENPYIPQTRCFFSYQHATVPDSFWGRGVIEMGYHPYKALQTEMRARADGLALANYPTIWRNEASLTGEQTRDDQDDHILKPGKEYLVSGNPNEAIREFKFSGPDTGSSVAIDQYQKSIASATGSFSYQGPLFSSKDTRVSGATVALQSFLRRAKQTALNIERDFLSPLIEGAAMRAMQYIPERYPPIDFSFAPKGALGIIQRDAERATLIELLQTLPPESPMFASVVKLIVESGPYEQKQEVLAIIDAQIAAALNPPPPPRDLGGEARLISAQSRLQEHQDQVALELEKLKRQDVELMIEARRTMSGVQSRGRDADPE